MKAADLRPHHTEARVAEHRRWSRTYAALQKRPPDGGVWTGPKVARYVKDRWRVTVRPETGWRWLRDLGFTLQVRRPSHPGFTLQVRRPSHPGSADRPTRRAWERTCGGG